LLGWLSVFAFMAAQDEGSRCVTLKVAASFLLPKTCSSWSTQITLLSIRTEDSLAPESVSDGCDFTTLRQPWNGLHGACRQITEAFPRNEAPRYLIRDRDRASGAIFRVRLRAMGILAKILASPSR
jgi:hypothetical protein